MSAQTLSRDAGVPSLMIHLARSLQAGAGRIARLTAAWAAVIACTVLLAACSGDADPPQPTGPTAPSITSAPANASVQVGQTATFSVTASGTGPLTYQWRQNGTPIAGATSASFTTPATTLGDNGATFDVVVTNAAGSVTSSAATLTVTAAPATVTITGQPQATSVVAGATATFSSSASCSSGTPSFQWQVLPQGGSAFTDITGATSDSYTTAATVTSDNASQYRVVVSCGTQSQTSSAAVLTVTTPPPATITLLPLINGLQPAAKINGSLGIAREAAGSYLFVDQAGLRRLSADLKTVTTIVRNASTAVDGPAATARIVVNNSGVAIDGAGNVYLNERASIRKLDTNGTMSTVAGADGVTGNVDATGSAARFSSLTAIALGPDGDLYVADDGNNTIRRVTAGGVVTTYAGSGTRGFADGAPGAAQFSSIDGIAVASNNDVYVGDSNRVRRIVRSGSSAGSVETFAGSASSTYADGIGSAAGIPSPQRMAIDGNVLYVSDLGGRIRRVDLTTASVTTFAGGSPQFPQIFQNDGTGTGATFDSSFGGIAVNPDGSLMVSDRQQLRTVSTGAVVRTISILGGSAVNSNTPPDGVLTAEADVPLASNLPAVVGSDGSGTVLVADVYHYLRSVDTSGTITTFTGLAGGLCCREGAGTLAQFGTIGGITYDSNGNVFVADGFAVRKVTPGGTVSLLAGSYSTFGAVDGQGSAAQFQTLSGLATDAAGNVYVADNFNHAIRKIDTSGNVTTLAGQLGGAGARVDGQGSAARFNGPTSIAMSDDGTTMYLCDAGQLRTVTTGGLVATIGGAGCNALAFDTDGTLYTAFQGGTVNAGFGTLSRRLPGSSTFEPLLQYNTSATDLAANPQKLGWVFSMAVMAPKTLAIASSNQMVKAILP